MASGFGIRGAGCRVWMGVFMLVSAVSRREFGFRRFRVKFKYAVLVGWDLDMRFGVFGVER